jgi:thiol-disulfide isomerase/thioredoxin
MALTYTPPVQGGVFCPEFDLPLASGEDIQSSLFTEKQRPFLVVFICNHCPYVKAIEGRLGALYYVFKKLDIGFLAINSNDAQTYPEDSFENMKLRHHPFPYAYDEKQRVAKAFQAVCTPDFFLYDAQSRLQYRGRLDDAWKDSSLVTRQELLEAAIDLAFKGSLSLDFKPTPSMGCSIKWIL